MLTPATHFSQNIEIRNYRKCFVNLETYVLLCEYHEWLNEIDEKHGKVTKRRTITNSNTSR